MDVLYVFTNMERFSFKRRREKYRQTHLDFIEGDGLSAVTPDSTSSWRLSM
jgi:hypothetical protein